MNKSYLAAAVLSLLAAIIRTIDGYSGPLKVAVESDLEQTVVAFFYLTWHMVTIFFIASAVALYILSLQKKVPPSKQLGRFIGIIFIAWSALIATVSTWFIWHIGTIIPMIVTLLIGVLSLMGARKAKAG